ncbi:MAG: hypothetical protein ACOC22_03510 [bacterium]
MEKTTKIYATERAGNITYYHNLDDARVELVNDGFELVTDLRVEEQTKAHYHKPAADDSLLTMSENAYITWINVY